MKRAFIVLFLLLVATSTAHAGKDGPGTKAVRNANDTIAPFNACG